MQNEFSRKITCNEKLYIALADCGINTTFRILLGVDKKPSAVDLECAFVQAVKNCPAVNLKYQGGRWRFSEDIPKLEQVETACEDISAHPIPFLDYRKHTVQLRSIYHKPTDRWFISVSFFHGACDGKSAMCFVEDIFLALNNQPLKKYRWDITDEIITKMYGNRHTEKLKLSAKCQFKTTDCQRKPASDVKFLSVDYQSGSISGKLSYAAAQLFMPANATVMIPVDIRKYIDKQDEILFGNLALPIFCDCGQKDKAQLLKEIEMKLRSGAALSLNNARHFAIYKIPLWLIRLALKQYLRYIKRKKRFVLCGIISYLGNVDGAHLENPLFEVLDIFASLDALPFCGLNIVAISFREKMHISIAGDATRISQKTYNYLAESVEKHIK